MKRYGPLLAVDGVLAVGDPGRHHLRVTPDAIIVREGPVGAGVISWSEVSRISLDVPTTRFRLPGLVSTVVLGALTALALSDLGVDPDDGSVTVVAAGEARILPLSRHHVGGYWRPTVDGAHRLLQQLISTPDQRVLLSRPESLIDLAAKLARSAA